MAAEVVDDQATVEVLAPLRPFSLVMSQLHTISGLSAISLGLVVAGWVAWPGVLASELDCHRARPHSGRAPSRMSLS
jgi:hypothetical protein